MGKPTGTRRVIINADDFGFSGGISEGILRGHRGGVVTSTTIATNMPAAEEAVRQLAAAPGLGVGVHLNVCQGLPLSQGARVLADADGVLRLSAMRAVVVCVFKPWLLKVIEGEFDAQIRWVLDHGIRPTHLDSHRHTHGYPAVFAGVARLARRYGIPFVRWHRERLPEGISDSYGMPPTAPLNGSGPVERSVKLGGIGELGGVQMPGAKAPLAAPLDGKQRRMARVLNVLGWINRRIAPDVIGTNGTWGIEQTGAITAEWLIRMAKCVPAGVTEIMVHPGLADGLDAEASRLRESREKELAAVCDPAVRDALREHKVELVHYGQLRDSR